MSLLSHLLRAGLRALPPTRRARVGDEIVALSLRRVREAPVWTRPAVAFGCLLDLVLLGLRSRLAGARSPTSISDLMDTLLRDLRFALRSLARAPRFTVAALLTLALGIGANSAIFSVVRGVILQPLPFPEVERFVHIGMDYGGGPAVSMPYYRIDWLREHTRSFAGIASYRGRDARLQTEGRFEPLQGLGVDASFLEVVGWPMALGRWFTGTEAAPDGERVVVLTHDTWQDRFGGDPGVLGRSLTLDEEGWTVIGVLPAAFDFPQAGRPVQYLVPLGVRPDPEDEGQNYPAVARLRDGVTPQVAAADLAAAWEGFTEAHPNLLQERERGPALASFEELHVGGLRTVLWTVMGAVAVVLLIACVNVANLLLARNAHRRHDVALRAALGASRAGLVRHVMAECVVLALAASVLALLVARWGVDLLLGMTPVPLPRADAVTLDGVVVVATLALGLGVAFLFGLPAAWPHARADLASTLRTAREGGLTGRRLRQGLIVVQSGLAVVLLVGAGLLVETLRNLRNVDAGFDPGGVLVASVPVRPPGFDTPGAVTELVDRVRANLPDRVVAAANLPLQRGLNIPVAIAGRPDDFEGAVEWRAVSPGYFDLLRIDLLRGRALADQDDAGGAPVAVVSQAFVDRWFPDQDPIGRAIEVGRWRGRYLAPGFEVPPATIVGVVADVRDRSLKEEPRRTVYVPFAQVPDPLTAFPVFMARGPSAGTLAAAVESADPRFPSVETRPLDSVVSTSLSPERFNATLLGTFAGLALVLTGIGIYGVVAYTVGQRTREIGIRVALGAARGEVVRRTVLEGIAPVLGGLVLGVGAAWALSRLVSSLVWGMTPRDPTAYVAAGVVLALAGLLACWVPAREASRVDPVRALGSD